MTKHLILMTLALAVAPLSAAAAKPLKMPRMIRGEWCYLGNLPGPDSKASLYAPCSEHVGGGGCEDITITRDGYVPESCSSACPPTSITLTTYGYDVRFACEGGPER